MTRVPQPVGHKGSLKWIQRAVNGTPELLGNSISLALRDDSELRWLSPLTNDDFAEYRDGLFLDRVGCSNLREPLTQFWPKRGPQWDALAQTASGKVVLVEAKAHVGEICSPPSQASDTSRHTIETALTSTATFARAAPRAPWIDTFYQLANRYAHLHFLRSNGIDAHLALVNFVGDVEVGGPGSAAEWEAAYRVVHHVLGLTKRHPLAPYVHHIYPHVSDLLPGATVATKIQPC